jgi:hypothetical protein
MARSGFLAQQCKCKNRERVPATAAISLNSYTLGVTPRRKSRSVTIYVCRNCGKNPRRKTRQAIIAAIVAAVKALAPAKPAQRRQKSKTKK